MEILSKTTEDTKRLAQRISGLLKPGNVVALYGDLGSGKTTFTGFLVSALGFNSRVQSPTFVLVRRYSKENIVPEEISIINHIDLYRMQNKEEVTDLGLVDMFTEPDSLTIIEWPELIESELPEGTIKLYFRYAGEDERIINVQNIH